MPTICTFFGIIIRMYFEDHSPPHFHAIYQEHEASVAIDTLEILAGTLPRRATELVFDWAELHQQELRDNWDRAQKHQSLETIEPLE